MPDDEKLSWLRNVKRGPLQPFPEIVSPEGEKASLDDRIDGADFAFAESIGGWDDGSDYFDRFPQKYLLPDDEAEYHERLNWRAIEDDLGLDETEREVLALKRLGWTRERILGTATDDDHRRARQAAGKRLERRLPRLRELFIR